MTLNHQDAIARVTVDGLAVCRFDGVNKWDLAFIREPVDDCHQLILNVEGQGGPIFIPPDAGPLTFHASNGHFPAGFPFGYFDNGPINRMKNPSPGDETENFRWTIDLENDVPHQFDGLKRPNPPTTLTRAFIHDAVFYTLNVSKEPLIMVPNGEDPNPPHPDPPVFGRTNDEISADIFCDSGGKLSIKLKGNDLFPPLDLRPQNPWKICLTNLCLAVPPVDMRLKQGDFQDFYKIIKIKGTEQALWGKPLPGEAQCAVDPINHTVSFRANFIGRPDCDTTRIGSTGTLDELFTP
jgi:hypothetical protein